MQAIRSFSALLNLSQTFSNAKTWLADRLAEDPKLMTHARAHQLGLLADNLREQDAEKLEDAALSSLDLSFFDLEEMLALIPPGRLVRLGVQLRTLKLPEIEDLITEIGNDADLDADPDAHFEKITDALNRIEEMGIDPDGRSLIETAKVSVEASVEELIERKEERDR